MFLFLKVPAKPLDALIGSNGFHSLNKKSIPVGGIRVVSNATIPQVRFSIQNIPSLSIAQPIFVELEV